jgi:hypothetical protein
MRSEDVDALDVNQDSPLIGVVPATDERMVRFFCSEDDADRMATTEPAGALALAGAWSDLEWDEMERGLDRIRHDALQSPTA